MTAFFEKMFFNPSWYHYGLMLLLLPLSLLYGMGMFLRRAFTQKLHFSIPIVSVGNLVVGGAGKTPFVIALAKQYTDVAVISRGYGRKSQGLVEVSARGKILSVVEESGDEAMLMARSLPQASVIVSEEREIAIELAMRKGAKLIIMDDGFNRVNIQKFEILLEPQKIKNYLPFPAGAFREFYWTKGYADLVVKETVNFKRIVSYENLSEKMLLVTAISQPERLNTYLPEGVVGKVYLEDHAYFDEKTLARQMKAYEVKTLLVTEKDLVKLFDYDLAFSVMKLELDIDEDVLSAVDAYVKAF